MGMSVSLYYKDEEGLKSLSDRFQIPEYYVSNNPLDIKIFLWGRRCHVTSEEVSRLKKLKSDLYNKDGILLYRFDEYKLESNCIVLS